DSDDAGSDSALVEAFVAAPPEAAALAKRLTDGCQLADGARLPLQRTAAAWLQRALSGLERGRLVVVDYADTSPVLVTTQWRSWLRTFRQHQPGKGLLDVAGSPGITCVVAIDQLAAVRAPTRVESQGSWLSEHGIGGLVEAARDTWRERAALGD